LSRFGLPAKDFAMERVNRNRKSDVLQASRIALRTFVCLASVLPLEVLAQEPRAAAPQPLRRTRPRLEARPDAPERILALERVAQRSREAYARDRKAQVERLQAGLPDCRFIQIDGHGHRELCWSPDGTLLAATTAIATNDVPGVGNGHSLLHLCDLSTGKVLHTMSDPQRQLLDVQFSSDGLLLVARSWRQEHRFADPEYDIVCWKATDGSLVRRIEREGDLCQSLAVGWTKDGIISEWLNSFRIFDLHSGEERASVARPDAYEFHRIQGTTNFACVGATGSAYDTRLQLLKLGATHPNTVATFTGEDRCVKLAYVDGAGAWLLTMRDAGVQWLDAQTGEQRDFATPPPGAHDCQVNFDRDLLVYLEQGTLFLRHLKTGAPRHEVQKDFQSLVLSPDGKKLALVDRFEQIVVWKIPD
jgi:WD40 repeat protein